MTVDTIPIKGSAPWVPYLWTNSLDLLGPKVTSWAYDQASAGIGYAHVAVAAS